MKCRMKLLFLLAMVAGLGCSSLALAAPGVAITAATGGGAISSSTNGATGTGAYTLLTGPVLTENNPGGISTGTIILNAPPGFEFNTGANVTATVNPVAGKSCDAANGMQLGISPGAFTQTVTPTVSTITINVFQKSTGQKQCAITFSNIQVRPTASTPLASGTITRSGTAGFNENPVTTDYGTLTEVVGPPTVATIAATSITTTGATLNGTLSSNGAGTTVTFEYGLTTGYGSTITATASPLAANAVNAAVSAAVSGLTCGTTYHFRVNGANIAGTANGSDATFIPLCVSPTVSKSFSPISIVANGTSTLTITIANPNSVAITGLAFTDNYPGGGTFKNAATPALGNTCGGTATGNAGATSLSLSGGSIVGGGSCTVSVTVTATAAGTYGNPPSAMTVSSANANNGSLVANAATLSVSATIVTSNFDACEATTPCASGAARLYTKLVGTGFRLDLVALDSGGSIDGSFVGPVTSIDLIAYAAANPANMAGAINRCPVNAASATINLGTNVSFSSGQISGLLVPPVAAAYRDVRVRVTYSGANYCSTDMFSIRPQDLGIGVTDSVGGAFPSTLAAGANFGLFVSGGPGYDGTPASLDSSAIAQAIRTHVGATDYTGRLLQSGNNSIVFPAAVSGLANAMVQYHDAGSFEVLAQKVIDNTFTGVDAAGTDCIAGSSSNTPSGPLYGCNIANVAASGLFGRFYPSYYTLTSSTVQGACGSSPNDFTYMGQSGINAGYTLSAWSQANPASLKLTKYTAGYSNLATVTVVAADGTNVSDLSSNLSPALTGTWSTGDYAVAVAPRTYARPAAPSGPYDSLNVAAGITDTDGAALSALDFKLGDPSCTSSCTHKKLSSASTKVRFGRLRLFNAFGSEKSDLAMPVQAQYWGGNSWVLNSADGCANLPANAFNLVGAPTGTSASAVLLTGGVGTLTLTKPSPVATGSFDVAANLGLSGNDQSCLTSHGGTAAGLPWLRSQNGNCAITYDRDPSARATFGIYAPETKKTIHVREQF